MLDTISVDPSDVFIDLGSGVGQVVLQVAASVQLKKCIGIEKADVPDVYGRVSSIALHRRDYKIMANAYLTGTRSPISFLDGMVWQNTLRLRVDQRRLF